MIFKAARLPGKVFCMKLLFILDTVEFPLAPTPALARRAAGLLAQRGHTVHLLELWDGAPCPPPSRDAKATCWPLATSGG